MEIQLVTDRNTWEKPLFQPEIPVSAEFLQSYDWGEFQSAAGHPVLRFHWVEANKVVARVQGFIHRLPLGFLYLYIPRAYPLNKQQTDLFLDFLQKQYSFVFVRFEPIVALAPLVLPVGLIEVKNRQPAHTLILDIRKSETELLASFHTKTRYNIALARKKGVEVRQENNVEIFWCLNQETTARDGFKSHDKKYYEEMLKMKAVQQLTAYYAGEPIASILVIFVGGVATYLHGVSSNSSRNLMAPYLLQWEGVRLAKTKGCTLYDFWGVAPPCTTDSAGACTEFHTYRWQATHSFTGITRFKAGFGGEHRQAGWAFEVPLRRGFYIIYSWLKKII